jgi:hypothetical protein
MAEGQQASVPIQSLLMQIDADRVCLVRTPFHLVEFKCNDEGPQLAALRHSRLA